eukprot:scaffold43640_cov33-Tisochrysis_lutea.AAC.1
MKEVMKNEEGAASQPNNLPSSPPFTSRCSVRHDEVSIHLHANTTETRALCEHMGIILVECSG